MIGFVQVVTTIILRSVSFAIVVNYPNLRTQLGRRGLELIIPPLVHPNPPRVST